ncbi:unnamed protein product [Paramecium pentaurelia]|uniref:Uncharacterized protein n=1 Tax=Paramecium pentaurelia TaxID=43138 RepID=A0A8S1UMC8_9CILI|nr:unnamed protein product [Paramecium pentaurelia]
MLKMQFQLKYLKNVINNRIEQRNNQILSTKILIQQNPLILTQKNKYKLQKEQYQMNGIMRKNLIWWSWKRPIIGGNMQWRLLSKDLMKVQQRFNHQLIFNLINKKAKKINNGGSL